MATPRQELIKMAAVRLRRWRNEKRYRLDKRGQRVNLTAHDAIEAVVDGRYEKHALGCAMQEYYRKATERAIDNLVFAVEKEAGLWD